MKRILFVDDEQELLDSLRVRLHKRRTEWDMVFVSSARAAFESMEQQSADLIVTDVRMPGMSGQELLGTVKSRWPNTIRIVLSGYAEQMQLLQLVSLAQQYLSKPCDTQQLENIIDRCFQLRNFLQGEQVCSLVGRIGTLPTMPKIYAQLQSALADPRVSINLVADIIGHDPAIAAKILQVVNSAFFRLPKPITRIKDAVAHLGFGSIRNLVMSAEIFSKWEHSAGPQRLDSEQLQTHALATAAACVALATGTPWAEDAWLTGLIHDIGYWVLIQECPADLIRVLDLAQAQDISSYQAEQQVIGATHAQIGAYLLGLWGLPFPLVEAVAYHHTPRLVTQNSFDLLGILVVAHSLLDNHRHALPISSEMTTSIDEGYFASLNPPYDWDEAKRRVQIVNSIAVS
jgi:HD-like signal output (HDOD) protein